MYRYYKQLIKSWKLKCILNNHNLGKQTASLPKANKKPKLLRISSRTLEAFLVKKRKINSNYNNILQTPEHLDFSVSLPYILEFLIAYNQTLRVNSNNHCEMHKPFKNILFWCGLIFCTQTYFHQKVLSLLPRKVRLLNSKMVFCYSTLSQSPALNFLLRSHDIK